MRQAVIKDALLIDARQNRVIVCEDMNFFWDEPELKDLKKMWDLTLSMEYMAEYFDRDPDEVLFALVHLARLDKIDRRKGGLLG